ncbi:hypothetical protein THTE_0091 [Thermogutta terrifontis]|uniref:Uncharacterized protein n=1 Tax=Thermogutta terrifontis TaxID=1331910 RepID=A0A286R9S0_9BACT|nr:hypothetical protein THTE_0091 [Thermogutta terrifontis]
MAFHRARQACPSERFLGGTCLSRPFFSEGPACRVRRLALDQPLVFTGD